MPHLSNYHQFDGLHWETGTVRSYFDYLGVVAPHTGRPYSEALLLGISGGAAMGYFSFAYEGYDPTVRILTRNTFDPWLRLLSRLGVAQDLRQTASADKAVANLVEVLDEGLPSIVWADLWSLPYNALAHDEGMWAMMPIIVYGYDEAAGVVRVADRARVGLTLTPAALAAARGRVRKDRHRLVTLAPPEPDRLPSAVNAGLQDCINLYTEKPPKGSAHNFGLAAYRQWAELLTKPKARVSWAKEFPRGLRLWAGLTSAVSDIRVFGKDSPAERDTFAAFLDEAATILGRPTLGEAADAFRRSGKAWRVLSEIMLPDSASALGEARSTILQRHERFLAHGNAARDEMVALDGRLATLRAEAAETFPLTETEVRALQEAMADQIMTIHDHEAGALETMRAAMGD